MSLTYFSDLTAWLKFAVQNTLRNPRRTLVTAGIAAIGTAAILICGGFALSTYESLSQMAARSTGHLIVGTPSHFSKEEDTPLQFGLDDFAALKSTLLADPQVRAVLPQIEFSGLLSNGDKSAVMLAIAVDPDAEFSVKGPFLKLLQGQLLTTGAKELEVILGDALARNLKAKPGSSLTLLASTTDGAMNALDVTVKGIVSTGVPAVDKRVVYTDIALAQRLLHSQRITSLGVFLDRMSHTDTAQKRIAAQLPQFTVQTWLDQAFYYQSVRDLYNRIFGVMGGMVGLIVLFVVTNAMAMAIVERTREIGSLRAMGTLPGQLIRSLAMEGVVIGGVGALCGSLLAAGISVFLLLVPVQMPPPPGRTTGYPLVITMDITLYALTFVAMVVLTLLASAWVARKTVTMPVVDALTHT